MANPGGRADGNRKQRGSRSLTFYGVGHFRVDVLADNQGYDSSVVFFRPSVHRPFDDFYKGEEYA